LKEQMTPLSEFEDKLWAFQYGVQETWLALRDMVIQSGIDAAWFVAVFLSSILNFVTLD
jgi:hypothetical protein